MKKQSRGFGILALIAVGVLFAWALSANNTKLEPISYPELIERIEAEEIELVEVRGDELLVTPKGEEEPTRISHKESGAVFIDQLREAGLNDNVDVSPVSSESDGNVFGSLLIAFGPAVLLIGFFIYMMRQAQGQGNQAMSFGKSRARVFGNEKQKVNFKDIAGNAEAKEDLHEVVEFLKFPKKFQSVGAKVPKGVLLVGSPGTGKTLMARAVAGEAGVPFFSISGSEFVEMFVGVGASRVRDLFAKAKKNAPCIIFIDEIDAVGRRRGSGMGGGHDEREQTLNQILVEMDGFEGDTNVIVVAATNRPDVLDPALLRPGRFDRRVIIPAPERKDREAILKVHFKNKPTDDSVNLDALAAKTAGSSGADLANIANEAAIQAARRNSKVITNLDVTNAFERVAIGPERKSRIMSDKEKELTAYHESGHALVGHVLPLSDPIHKVTIISRGGAGGVTWSIPPEDKSYHSINDYKDVLARVLGGRMAEKVVYGDDNVTTGAGNDLQKAYELARNMVVEQGMGKKLRHMVYHSEGGGEGLVFERVMHERPYSEDTAKEIDDEIESLISEAAKRAEAVIAANQSYLKKLAAKLLEVETVDDKEVVTILKGAKMPKGAELAA